jgi:hypothetical protein
MGRGPHLPPRELVETPVAEIRPSGADVAGGLTAGPEDGRALTRRGGSGGCRPVPDGQSFLELATPSARRVTNDEVLYIPAGYRQLTASDYRINPTTPPVASTLAALACGRRAARPGERTGEPELAWAYRFIHEANDVGHRHHAITNPDRRLSLGLAGRRG